MDSRRFEQIKEMGRSARRGGQKREACPFRAGSSEPERTAWLTGWDEENMARRVRR